MRISCSKLNTSGVGEQIYYLFICTDSISAGVASECVSKLEHMMNPQLQ